MKHLVYRRFNAKDVENGLLTSLPIFSKTQDGRTKMENRIFWIIVMLWAALCSIIFRIIYGVV